jgi:hypothetical protein
VVGEDPWHALGVDPMNGNPPVTVSPALSTSGGDGVLAEMGGRTGLGSLWRHVMCKDKDANYQPIAATTTFAPTDLQAMSLLTGHANTKFHTVWYYRHDSAKAWNYYTTINWYPGSEGNYYVWFWIAIAGYTPSTFYPWSWKVDIFIDDSYQATDYFEITDDGKKSAMCESVDSSGNCVNEKSVFNIGVDSSAYHYLRLDHIAYFNEATGHVHDFKCVWYAPDGSVYRTYQNYWPDYKDSNPNYDYWGYGYDPYDYISIGSGTPTGTWTVKTYLDQYYDSGWLWYGPISTITFTVSSQPNHPPTLSSGTVDPSRGYPSTQFTFLVKYTDSDGDQAATKRLYVYDNGWGYVGMDHFAGNPADGEWFIKLLTGFSVGNHQFFFYFADGRGGEDYDPDSGYYSFVVDPEINYPDIRVEPTSLSFQYPPSASVEPGGTVKMDPSGYQVDVSVVFAGLQLAPDGDYSRVSSQGCEPVFDTGYPILPAKSFYLLMPAATSVQSYEIVYHDTIMLPGTFAIRPAPAPEIAGLRSIQSRPSDSQHLFREDVARIGGVHGFRGYRLLSLTFFAGQYTPESGTLVQINRLTLRLRLVPTDKVMIESLLRGMPADTEELEKIVVNPGVATTYTALPTTQPSTIYKYVIITGSDLVSAFQPLADWKTQKTGSAKIETVSSISSSYSGVDTAEKIRNFIKDAYSSWGTQWVLLGGDIEVVPCRDAFAFAYGSDDDQNIPADLYYSDLDGNWNANGNSVFGEISDNVDLFPDLYVGRAPVNTASEATTFVDKVLTYERSPPPGYLLKALLVAYWLDESTNEAVLKDYIASNYLSSYATTKVYEASNGAGVSLASVVNTINDGVGIFAQNSHGNPYVTPPLGTSDVDGLNNGDRLFLFYSMACDTNRYDLASGDAISEHYILNDHGGAVAYVGNSRFGWYVPGYPGSGPSDQYEKEFFRLFHDGYMHVGEILARSKAAFISSSQSEGSYRWIQYGLNLLGDPEMDIRTQEAPSQPITVYNDGNAVLSVTATTDHYSSGEPSGWLSASPRVYQVSQGSSQKVTVTVNPSGLATGRTYHGWLEIASNDPDENPVTVTVTFTVNAPPSLSVGLVSPPSPPNGGTVTSSPVTLEAQVTSSGASIQGATVTIYVDGSQACSGGSDSSGYYSCSYPFTQSGHTYSWYASASKSGYNPGTSPTWTFTYQPVPSLSVGLVSPPSPPNGGTVTSSPVTLEAQVTSSGASIQGATVTIYVDGSQACSGGSDSSGYYSCPYSLSQGGHTYSWYAAASKSGYTSGTSSTWTFTYQPGQLPDLTVESVWVEKAEAGSVSGAVQGPAVLQGVLSGPAFPAEIEPGESFYIYANVTNIGGADAFGYFIDAYFDSFTGRGGPADIGAGQVTTWYWGPWTAEQGIHLTRWVVDPDNQIQELDETNNEEQLVFTIGAGGPSSAFFHPATEFWFSAYDMKNAEWDAIHIVNTGAQTVNVQIYISGMPMESTPISIPAGGATYRTYPGVEGSPVHVVGDQPLWVTQRILGWTAMQEIYGCPADEASTELIWTWYDLANAKTDDIYVVNPSSLIGDPSAVAHVDIYVGSDYQTSLTVWPGTSEKASFPGKIGGPLRLVSDMPVFASQRVIGFGDFAEIIGLPSWYTSTETWFNWYDMKGAQWDAIHMLNPGAAATTVDIYVGGTLRDSLTLMPGAADYRAFPGLIGGPVRVVSSQPIWVTQRIIGWGGWKEVFGIPVTLASTDWYLTWYDMKYAQWNAIHIINPSASDAQVEVYVGGQLLSTLTVHAGEATYVTYPGLITGPVVVISDVPIMMSQRILGWQSFEETIGASLS